MTQKTVLIVGAGPAGLYAAEKLAKLGVATVILNRDIKPGGLAEFGIYPNKHKMKRGLRKAFTKILSMENVSYFGNVVVEEGGSLTLNDLRGLGFDAIIVAVGAQGTNWLGLPGEEAKGVYHAKDLVYHYNALPPFSEHEFAIGDRVCVVGIGNVSLDIVHWLVCDKKVEAAITVARRGPAERAYTKKEMKLVAGALDLNEMRQDHERTKSALAAVGQDPDALLSELTAYSDVPLETETETRFWMRFLRSPKSIELDADGAVIGLRCDVTRLAPGEGRMRVEKTGEEEVLACDTVVFAIGDSIEPGIGVPVDPSATWKFAVCSEPWETHPDRPRYMVYDPAADAPMHGVFVVGWARRASDGLVGKARADAVQGCSEVLAYIDGLFGQPVVSGVDSTKALRAKLESSQIDFVGYDDVRRLEEREAEYAAQLGLEHFRFSSQQKMLDIIRGRA